MTEYLTQRRPDDSSAWADEESCMALGYRCLAAPLSTVAAVDHGLAQRDLAVMTNIGIDEISRKLGHVYVTNVYDLKTSRLLWKGEGCGKAALGAFFEWFWEEGTARLEGICRDMWQPYIDAIKARAPRRVPGKGQGPQGAYGQDPLYLAEELLETH